MRSFNVQVQIDKLEHWSYDYAVSTLQYIARYADKTVFDHHPEDGYFNVLYSTKNSLYFWKKLKALQHQPDFKNSAIVSCTGDSGWNDYLLLHHYDPVEKLDPFEITTEEDLNFFKEDSDWQAAFYAAIVVGGRGDKLDLSPIIEVIAADSGENDGPDWICVVKTNQTGWAENKPPYCVMRAGCDYTGWDCQSGGKVEYYNTREEATSHLTLTAQELERLGIKNESL